MKVTPGEDHNNYVVLSTSGNGGATWKEVLIIDPDGGGNPGFGRHRLWISFNRPERSPSLEKLETGSGNTSGVTADPDPGWLCSITGRTAPGKRFCSAGGCRPGR